MLRCACGEPSVPGRQHCRQCFDSSTAYWARQRERDRPLFGAEDLRKIERVNEEIDRNQRRARGDLPGLPLLDSEKEG